MKKCLSIIFNVVIVLPWLALIAGCSLSGMSGLTIFPFFINNPTPLAPTPTPTPAATPTPDPTPMPFSTPWATPTPLPSSVEDVCDYGDLNDDYPGQYGAPSMENVLMGMEIKVTNLASPYMMVMVPGDTGFGGNVLMGLYSDSGSNTVPLTLIAQTAPFTPPVDGNEVYIPLTNVAGLKLAATNYWIMATAQFNIGIYAGVDFDMSSVVNYTAKPHWDCFVDGWEYDFRNNLMPVSITYLSQSICNYDLYLITTNN